MAITPQYLDELRARISLADVIGRRLEWDKRKSNPSKGDYWACCPFHGEKTPSFHVEDRKGFFYCFGCHEKGSAIDFVMKMDNLSFPEAVETLAGQAGMPPPERDPRAAEKRERRDGLVELMDAAQRFYRMQFDSAAAREAREYLERRGLSARTLESFGIGFAPRGPNALGEYLMQSGATRKDLVEAGLVGERDDASTYDRFRERIMFPIRDPRGRVIAFGGRAMRDDVQAKYLNSPETPLFSKGRVLYNHGPAREALGKGAPLIVAEGYMDVIALAQAGFAATVAPLGTALTEDQLALLWRMADEPVLAMDGDRAGLRAAERVARLALPHLAPGKTLRFALLPDGQDPDDLIRNSGSGAMRTVIDQSEPLAEMIWRSETEGQAFDTPERRAKLNESVRKTLAGISHREIRDYYIDDFKERRTALFAPSKPATGANHSRKDWRVGAMQQHLPTNETRRSALAAGGKVHPRNALETEILRLSLGAPDGLHDVCDSLADAHFANQALDLIRSALISAYFDLSAQDDSVTPEALLNEARARMTASGIEQIDRIASGVDDSCTRRNLRAAMERHRCSVAVEDEQPDRDSEFAGSADEVTYKRMLAARRARELARQSNLYPPDENETVSVQDYIDQKIWIKTPKTRRQP